MGIMSNTISMYQYEVGGTPAAEKTVSVEWIQDRLEYGRFEPITDLSTISSVGWVHFDDPNDSDFSNINSFSIDIYLAFTLHNDKVMQETGERIEAILDDYSRFMSSPIEDLFSRDDSEILYLPPWAV